MIFGKDNGFLEPIFSVCLGASAPHKFKSLSLDRFRRTAGPRLSRDWNAVKRLSFIAGRQELTRFSARGRLIAKIDEDSRVAVLTYPLETTGDSLFRGNLACSMCGEERGDSFRHCSLYVLEIYCGPGPQTIAAVGK